MEESVVIRCGDLNLEGRLFEGGPNAAVLCHPHPLYGGSMDNNVVQACARVLQELGWTSLRFNFRGVGRSQGAAGEGEAEVEDVLAAILFLQEARGISLERLILVGYSFGAWVGLRALEKGEPILGWVAVAPPVGLWDFSFARGISGRKLLLAGDRDDFCPVPAFNALAQSLPEPKAWAILPGADHFFWGQEPALRSKLKEVLPSWAL
jgi:hypothetical protein